MDSSWVVTIAVGTLASLIPLAYIYPVIPISLAIVLAVFSGAALCLESTWSQLVQEHQELKLRDKNETKRIKSKSPKDEQSKEYENCFTSRLLISKDVDLVIEQLVENVIRDFILSWYLDIVNRDEKFKPRNDESSLKRRLKNEIWIIVSRFLSRIRTIDKIQFFTKDVIELLTTHVKQFNECIYNDIDIGEDTSSRSSSVSPPKVKKKFKLSSFLESEEKELQFVRKMAIKLVHVLVPSCYLAMKPFELLLVEVVSNVVIYQTVNLFSDSNYLNKKIIELIDSIEIDSKKVNLRAKYAFSETYDEFISLIKSTKSIDELKRIRYLIVAEIMQATAINNLKRERNSNNSSWSSKSLQRSLSGSTTRSSVKGDHLLSRNLPRYINQLRYAKKVTEKQISTLSEESNIINQVQNRDNDQVRQDKDQLTSLIASSKLPTSKKILSFSLIMSTKESRRFLYKFLSNTLSGQLTSSHEKLSHYLVLFYDLVSEMKVSNNVKQIEIAHQLLTNSSYLTCINGHIRIPKEILKEMESFLMGDSSSAIPFYQTQKVTFKILEDRYYPSFIVSKEYDDMLIQCSELFENVDQDNFLEFSHRRQTMKTKNASFVSHLEDKDQERTLNIIERHIELSLSSLDKLKSSCVQKTDALAALKHAINMSSKPTDHTMKLIQRLGQEVTEIKDSISELEGHVSRSELWLKFVGQWRAELYSIQKDDEPEVPVAAIIVHLGPLSSDMRCDAWVIARSINEVINLKRKLIKYKPSLKRIEIFRLRNLKSRDLDCPEDLELIKKAKSSLNLFFQEVLTDEVTFKSEEVFLFFLSSPGHLRQPLEVLKNPTAKDSSSSSLPFASWLGFNNPPEQSSNHGLNRQFSSSSHDVSSSSSSSVKIGSDEELSRYFDELLDGKESVLKLDDIAESGYHLLNELFELKEGGSWLRKSLVAFVQISFGSTINRQIHESVSWLTSEAMIHYYLTTFRDSFWDENSKGSKESPTRASSLTDSGSVCDLEESEDQKRQTYLVARNKVMANIPDILSNLLGDNISRKGIFKFFEMIQFKKCNKHLLYKLLDIVLFPKVNS